MSISIPVPAGVAKSVNRSFGGAPFGIRETEGRPLGHLEIRVAQVASPAAFWTFQGWDGVRLRHFNIWGPEWCPFTHILNLGAGNGVHLNIFQIWAQVWVK